MKSFKIIFILFLLSAATSAVVFFLNSAETITSSTTDVVGEIAVVAVPIFIFLLFVYLIVRALGKTLVKRNKKSLPNQEGPKAV
ncbi:hypothetical protein ACLI09_13785 [Flavobacterium sp. RHBU_24]|uniref:hypothetical protein n=1 Tax=Flavobacterium sp. RHBU_24 TaxID=3391185 RepID=UPI0039846E81